MARLFSSGFELNSNTSGVEFTSAVGSPTIQRTVVRSGTYAGQITGLTSATAKNWIYQFSSASAGPFFCRFYFRYATAPSAGNTIFSFDSATSGVAALNGAQIRFNNAGTLNLLDGLQSSKGTSAALIANQWYRIEVKIDVTNSTITALLDGVQFANSTTATLSNVASVYLGGNIASELQTAGNWYFEDIAVNNSTGSFQTTYPGSGSIIHLHPAAIGDVNTFATQTGGTAGSGSNYTRVNEVPPDDATTLNGSNTINQEDLFRLEKIQAAGAISLVQTLARFHNNVADTVTAIKFEIKKASGGTITQSAAIIPNTTTWNTNAIAAPRTPALTLYQDPNTVNWDQNSINNMQIGYKITTGGTNRIEVSNIVALVETVDIVTLLQPLSLNNYEFVRVGDGMSVGEKIR